MRSGRALDLRDRSYFQRAQTATGPVLEAAIGRLTGKGVLQVAYPVRDPAGALRFILLASLDMQDYGQTMVHAQRYERMNLQVWNADGSVVMDFHRPEVRAWWGAQHAPLLDAGVAGIWDSPPSETR